tara:strand:+ start:186 stop:665 length:480 start_codon:yes stop_codon:yes gene_type:complete
MTIGSNAGEDFYKSGVIEDKIMERQWTLTDIINKEDIVSELAKELISGMDIETKYFIICDTDLPKGEMSFAKAIYNRTFDKLEEWITAKLAKYLKTATVNFNDEPIEEINKEMEEELEGELERLEDGSDENEKIVTLKDRIKLDTKQLTDEEMRKRGMR